MTYGSVKIALTEKNWALQRDAGINFIPVNDFTWYDHVLDMSFMLGVIPERFKKSKIDINTYLPDDLLYKSDSASMAYGLELRSPFLDHILMEKVASMPSDIKLKFITKKKILKEIAIKNKLLPKEIIYRFLKNVLLHGL